MQIVVRDNNVDQALKALKKKMQREGLFREMKRRDHFEKPSERKAREKAEAVRRARSVKAFCRKPRICLPEVFEPATSNSESWIGPGTRGAFPA